MATESTTNTTTIIARADQHDIDLHKASDRVNFGSIKEPIDVPYLLGVQTDSFDWLIGNERWKARVEEDEKNGTNTVAHTSGLDEVFNEISPIDVMSVTFSPSTETPPCVTARLASDLEDACPLFTRTARISIFPSWKSASSSSVVGILSAFPWLNSARALSCAFCASSSP